MKEARPKVFLTLNIPGSGLSAKPLVASHNGALLSLFKSFVLHDYERRVLEAPTAEDRIADEAELTRLYSLLDIFIPEAGGDNGN
ncbi:hypothetical protein ACFLYI_02060 [Chloroflexota bacterium]